MPDISMCMQRQCTNRNTCYRYLAIPSEFRQSYISPDPDGCDHHWPVVDAGRTVEAVDKELDEFLPHA